MAVTYKNGEILSASLLEHMEIYRLVTQRARKKGKKPITLEALLKEQRLAISCCSDRCSGGRFSTAR